MNVKCVGTTSPHGGAGSHVLAVNEKDPKHKKRMDFVDRAKTTLTLRSYFTGVLSCRGFFLCIDTIYVRLF